MTKFAKSFFRGWKVFFFLSAFTWILSVYSLVTVPLSSASYIPKSDILTYSLRDIEQSYFDARLVNPQEMYKKALEAVSAQVAPVLVEYSATSNLVTAKILVGNQEKTFQFPPLKNLSQLQTRLEEAFQFIKANLAKDDLDNIRDVDYAAINGLLSTLDPHSNLFTPTIYQDFNADAQGSYGGVGMVISQKDGKIQVVSIISKNSPAYKASIHAKDVILQIDQVSTAGMSVEDAKNRLRGPKNTKISLLIERPGEAKPLEFQLVRDEIKLVSVESYKFSENQKNIGYIRISRVAGGTTQELRSNLTQLSPNLQDFKGLIIDLRSNPGGLLNEAIEISNTFLSSGVIVSIAEPQLKNIVDYKARPYATGQNYPIVILVNRFSASAAEIIAAALQKNKRAILLGEKTFGKGSVQTIVSNFDDGSALKLTTSQYLTPGRNSIQSIGVVPDVAFHPVSLNKDHIRYLPLRAQAEKDLQNSLHLQDTTQAHPSLYNLDYLVPKKAEAVLADEEQDSAYGVINPKILEQDFLVSAARNILLASKGPSYQDLLQSAGTYVQQTEKKQASEIKNALQKFGVAWRWPNPNPPDASVEGLKVQYSLEKKQGESWVAWTKPFPPESAGRLVVQLTNNSTKPYYNLASEIDSDDMTFTGGQLIFGSLLPKQTKKWEYTFKTSTFEVERGSLLYLKTFSYPGTTVLHQTPIVVNIAPNVTPNITYKYDFIGKSAQPALNQQEQLRFTLQNDSSIDSGPISVILKNGSIDSLFLNQGRSFISNIPAQGSVDATFGFRLTSWPKDKQFKLLVTVLAEKFPLASFEQKIQLQTDQPYPNFANALPSVVISPLKASGGKLNLTAQISDKSGLKDIFVLQNNRKIFYARLTGNLVQNYTLDLPLTLDKATSAYEFVVLATDLSDVRAQSRIKFLRQTGTE